MKFKPLHLQVIPDRYGIIKLPSTSDIPSWVLDCSVYNITKTPDELSIVCSQNVIPEEILCERGWKGLRVMGHLSFNSTGVVESIAKPLAEDEISIFTVSTFDTDYVFVKESQLDQTVNCLKAAGHHVDR